MEGKNMRQLAVLLWSCSRRAGGGQLVKHEPKTALAPTYLTGLAQLTVPFGLEGAHDMSTQGAADKWVVC